MRGEGGEEGSPAAMVSAEETVETDLLKTKPGRGRGDGVVSHE